MGARVEPSTQDLIDAIGSLQEAVESLELKIEDLSEVAGHLFNAFDPKCGETLRQIVDAAAGLSAPQTLPADAETNTTPTRRRRSRAVRPKKPSS